MEYKFKGAVISDKSNEPAIVVSILEIEKSADQLPRWHSLSKVENITEQIKI